MEHTVQVTTMPVEIEFPRNLQRKIRFDRAQQQLVFRGFMCKSEYDQLLRLNQDVNYQNAVTQLFQQSTIPNAPQLRKLGRMLATLTIACFLLAALVWWFLLYNQRT